MRVQNHTDAWRQFGAITKINLYYSWTYGCLQGIKATYGYKAGNAQMIGHQKRLYTSHLKLGGWENINRVDVRQVGGCLSGRGGTGWKTVWASRCPCRGAMFVWVLGGGDQGSGAVFGC